MKKTLNERALLARVARKLEREGRLIRKCREGSKLYPELGRFYVINANTSMIEAHHCKLDDLAAAEGLLEPWEVLEK